MTYTNVNNFIVIQADNRNPDVSWAHHRDRGSLGGVDCVAPYGTPIYAPDDCVLSNIPNNGSGGNTIRFNYASGWIDEMMHLSSFVTSGQKLKGQLVGYSGDSGSPGQPHVHWHRIASWYNDTWGGTNRYNPFNYFASTPAGGGSKPIEQEEDNEMRLSILANSKGLGILIDSVESTWRGITAGESKGLQAQGVKVVPVPDAEFEETKKFLKEAPPK